MNELIEGLHHITLVTRNYSANNRFYTEILGLKCVKLTVNQDDIYHRHLFYSDENGTPGSTITFFEWPELPRGKVGLTSPHHLSYEVMNVESIPKWKKWLLSNGVPVRGPFVRDGRISLYLRDPDGVLIEITKQNEEGIDLNYIQEEEERTEKPRAIERSMKLIRFNHSSPVATDINAVEKFFTKVLGLKKNYVTRNEDKDGSYIMAIGNEKKPDFMRYIVSEDAEYGKVGVGSIHHIALLVESDEEQRYVMRKLQDLGIRNSGIIDRFWFKSLYFRDPEGNLLEVATKGPEYTVDEPQEELGKKLVLPAWLEPRRSEIETKLRELDSKNREEWPPNYDNIPERPEQLMH
jgi:glyoxalase family protein